MKFSIVAVLVVVLALAHGSLSAEVNIEQLREQVDAIRGKIVLATTDLAEKIKALDLANQAQTQLEPLTAEIKTMATNLQAQLQPLAENMQAQVQPMVTNLQTEMQDLFRKVTDQIKADNVQVQLEDIFRKLTDQLTAIGN